MDALAAMNMELYLFVSSLKKYLAGVRPRSDRDRFIQHFFFDQYIKYDIKRDYRMCAIIKELSDKFTTGGMVVLKREIKQLDCLIESIPV